jgi:hypothetical protein
MKKILGSINVFIVSVAVFSLTLCFGIYVYAVHDAPVGGIVAKESEIEVTLPALEWDKYMKLSKKISISSNPKVKRRVAENQPVIDDEMSIKPGLALIND